MALEKSRDTHVRSVRALTKHYIGDEELDEFVVLTVVVLLHGVVEHNASYTSVDRQRC